MDYIEKTLGVETVSKPWKYAKRLPCFLADLYAVRKVTVGTMPTLFVYPKADLAVISTLQKHIARIQKEESLPVVLVLTGITRYRREALIQARIPFVVPDKQLYLPFMGAVLQERFAPEELPVEKLQPAAQVLFFYYLYRNQRDLYTTRAVSDLGYSAMTITRAARQLVQTGCFSERKDGVQKVLTAAMDRRALFEQMRPFLIDPVKKRGFVRKEAITDRFYLAGDSALARQTMLSEQKFVCYAAEARNRVAEDPFDLQEDRYAAVELWKYDPSLLGRDGMVDPLSLAMSMAEQEDPRVEEAVEEMLEKLWGDRAL